MSITSALQIGVSGLQANSSRVQNISSNIANANTVGYRRTFSEFVTQNTGSTQAGVLTDVRANISTNGNIMGTDSTTDLAVQGDGFFVVSRNANDPVESNYYLTRAGSFTPDQNGNLRNSAGYFLSGFPTDAAGNTGSVSSTSSILIVYRRQQQQQQHNSVSFTAQRDPRVRQVSSVMIG